MKISKQRNKKNLFFIGLEGNKQQQQQKQKEELLGSPNELQFYFSSFTLVFFVVLKMHIFT
jgi:hypothetical protein